MAASHKIVALCFCLMLASFGVLVDAGQGMMGGMFGGGGKGHHGGHGALETLLAAGLLAKLLRGHHHHHGHHHHEGRAAYGVETHAVPYAYDVGYGGHGYGY